MKKIYLILVILINFSILNAQISKKQFILSSNSPVCEGGDLELNAPTFTNSYYIWTGPMGFSSNLQNPAIINVLNSNEGIYTCKIYTNNILIDSSDIFVVVKPTPQSPQISSNSPVCESGTLNLYASSLANATFQWFYPNESYFSNIQNPIIENNEIDGNFMCIAITNDCQSLPTYTNVELIPYNNGLISGSSNFCLGFENINVNLTNYEGTIQNWQKRLNSGEWLNIENNTNSYFEIPTDAGIYEYRAVLQNNNCSAFSDIYKIYVYSQTIAGNLTNINDTICLGNSTENLMLNDNVGIVLNWQKRLNLGDWININSNSNILTELPSEIGNWQYRAVVKNGNCNTENTNIIDIDVFNKGLAGEMLGGNDICFGEQTDNLELTNYTGIILKWQKSLNSSEWIDIENNTQTFSEIPTSDGNWKYRVVLKTDCETLYSSTASVNVNPIPQIPIIFLNHDTLISSSDLGNQWYDQNGIIIGENNKYFLPKYEGNFFTILTINNCISEQSNIINYNPLSIPENMESKIEIFPNPNNGIFKIKFNNDLYINSITIENIVGQTEFYNLIDSYIDNYSINFTQKKTGIFYLKIQTIDKQIIKKIILY